MISTPRALVVDDETMVALLIEDVLRSVGYHVTVANTLEALEDALRAHRFDLAVTDTDFADAAAMQQWNVGRIIVCSGKSMAHLGEMYPGFEIVLKPFEEAAPEDRVALAE